MEKFKWCSKIVLFVVLLVQSSFFAFSQKSDTTKKTLNIRANVNVTNNGLSLIPSFSLGKPALLINAGIGGKRLSFEPEFWFSMEGKPWTFIFIWRYKLINQKKFQFTAGTHLPALNFTYNTVPANGIMQNVIETQRVIGLELVPNYSISKNISVGMYYLYGRGFDPGIPVNLNFIVLRSSISKISISKELFLRFNPQVYYLNTDKVDGYYFSGNLTLVKQNFPVSISTMMYKAIKTNIGGKDIDWNISLTYSLNKNYFKK